MLFIIIILLLLFSFFNFGALPKFFTLHYKQSSKISVKRVTAKHILIIKFSSASLCGNTLSRSSESFRPADFGAVYKINTVFTFAYLVLAGASMIEVDFEQFSNL